VGGVGYSIIIIIIIKEGDLKRNLKGNIKEI
jgi:hypothetical protein